MILCFVENDFRSPDSASLCASLTVRAIRVCPSIESLGILGRNNGKLLLRFQCTRSIATAASGSMVNRTVGLFGRIVQAEREEERFLLGLKNASARRFHVEFTVRSYRANINSAAVELAGRKCKA